MIDQIPQQIFEEPPKNPMKVQRITKKHNGSLDNHQKTQRMRKDPPKKHSECLKNYKNPNKCPKIHRKTQQTLGEPPKKPPTNLPRPTQKTPTQRQAAAQRGAERRCLIRSWLGRGGGQENQKNNDPLGLGGPGLGYFWRGGGGGCVGGRAGGWDNPFTTRGARENSRSPRTGRCCCSADARLRRWFPLGR